MRSAHAERVFEICANVEARAATLIKERFMAGYVSLARECGFDLTKGDVALVHPFDVPQAVTLTRRDCVWVDSKLAEPGKCLFVAARLKHLPPYTGLHA